jgi:hypothetical protein
MRIKNKEQNLSDVVFESDFDFDSTTKLFLPVDSKSKYTGLNILPPKEKTGVEYTESRSTFGPTDKKLFSYGQSNGYRDPVVYELFKQNENLIQKAATNILQGKFPIAPFSGQINGLTYSPFTDIMRFDATLGDRYNERTDEKKRVAQLQRINSYLGDTAKYADIEEEATKLIEQYEDFIRKAKQGGEITWL